MTNLISLDNISLSYGLDYLLDHINLKIMSGERICLIGRNGEGKSSLLKIIEGNLLPDSGSVWRQPHLRLSRLEQELPQHTTATIYQFVASGLDETGQLLTTYHALLEEISHSHAQDDLRKLEQLQNKIDAINGWEFEQNIKTILNRLELNGDDYVSKLSGGWQRRAALAKALVSSPELLLLDEPTNHLDISAVQWLEEQLVSCHVGLIFITHDRALLQRLATRIIELDRGNLTSWPGDYTNFLRYKEEMLHAEAKHNQDFDKKLAQEEVWIRQGIKARRTRNEGRVRALEKMRLQRAKRRQLQDTASFNLNEAEQSGHLVVKASNISYSIEHAHIVKNFSIRIMRGDRIGLLGPNGIGKTTLLNLLLGNLIPQAGSITQGTKLQIAYFDQFRRGLNLEKSVIDNVMEGSELIEINNRKQHVISYLSDFLFTPKRALTPVKALSGGECNRLLFARLFSKPSNLLILDEPTNDLDIETLELLEELLSNYQGTVLLVSHDRAFLDNVVTSLLVFEGDGKINEYVGNYHTWLEQQERLEKKISLTEKPIKSLNKETRIKKLSFKEQHELDKLPEKIEELEKKQTELQQRISSADFYKQDYTAINQTIATLKKIEADLEQAYQRWSELDK